MKKKSPLWISLFVIIVILGLVAASGPGSDLIYRARHTFRTERFLMIENGNLVFHKQTWGSSPSQKLVKKLKNSVLTARSTGSQIQITLNGKSILRPSRTNDIIVSPVNQTVFFTEYEDLPASKTGQKLVYARLYKWTEAGGFETMNPSGIGTGSPRLSADEQVLIVDNYSTTPVPGGTVVYDLKTKKNTAIRFRDLEAVVNAQTILAIVRDRESSDDAYGQLMRIDISNGKSEPVLPGELAGRVTTFDGSIWVLLKTPAGKYQVVRLSSDLNRIEETIAVK